MLRIFTVRMIRFQKMFRRIKNSPCLLAVSMIACLTLFFSVVLIKQLTFDLKYSVVPKLTDDFIVAWNSEDPRLISHIRKNYLYPPKSRSVPYNLDNPNRRYWSQKTQSEIIEKLFNGKRNGFFVECGAFDGETYSNTLSFETYFNWTGILIEADYLNVKKLLSKNRKSWILNGCLGDGDKPQKLTLYGGSYVGGLAKYMSTIRNLFTRYWQPMSAHQVWCFPMISILMAVNRTKVDFLSLDVEGGEVDILKAAPWQKIDIDLIQVEYMVFQGIFWDKDLSKRRRQQIHSYIIKNLPQLKLAAVVSNDVIYMKKDRKL